MLVAAFWRRGALATVILVSGVSLALNVALNIYGGGTPAFFLLPTRIWELGAGAALALFPTRSWPGGRLAQWAANFGTAAAAVSLLSPGLLDPAIPPALPAVCGTCLIIWAGMRGATAVGRLLSSVPFVFVGNISYSLYLWHWPLLVFPHYYFVRDLTVAKSILAVAAAVACSIFSWRYVNGHSESR